ncbi:hypothetical protein GPSY_2675 [Paraglaciecola psychrophila 170]|nr:hypothetical protein GPSY_2675 [Paraglaciecola psychrophila 170]
MDSKEIHKHEPRAIQAHVLHAFFLSDFFDSFQLTNNIS